MPTIGSFSGSPSTNIFAHKLSNPVSSASAATLSEEQQEQMTRNLFNTIYSENRGMNPFTKYAAYATGAAVDLADTVASSLIPLGPERGGVWDFVGDYGGSLGRDLENFYQRSQSGVETISGIAGAIGTGYLAGSLLLPRISNAVASSALVNQSKLWQAGSRANAAVRSKLLESQAAAARNDEAFSIFSQAGRQYLSNRAMKGVGIAAFEEAAIAATMNTNRMVWSDEMSDNLLFGALGLGIGGALGGIGARAEMRKMLNSPTMLKLRADTIDPQGVTFLREHQPTRDVIQQLADNDAIGKESAVLTSLMVEARQANPETADAALISRFSTLRAQAESQAMDVLQKITRKGIAGAQNTRFSTEGSIGKHLQEALHDDPLALFGADSLGSFGRQKAVRIKPVEVADEPTADVILSQARQDFERFKGDRTKLGDATRTIRNQISQGDAIRYQAEVERLTKQVSTRAKEARQAEMNSTPLGAMLWARGSYINALKASRNTRNIRVANRLEKQQMLVMVNKGWLPAETPEALALSDYRPGNIKLDRTTKGANRFKYTMESGAVKHIDERINIGDFHTLTVNERMETIEAVNQFFTEMKRAKLAYVVPAKASWFQLDSAIEFEKQGGKVDWSSQAKLRGKDEAEVASLKAKAELVSTKGVGGYWERQALNLPLPSALERIYDPAGDSFNAILDAVRNGADYATAKKLRQQMLESHGFDLRNPDPDLTGNIFNFNRDKEGKWREIPVAAFDTEPVAKVFDDSHIAEQIAELKASRFITLAKAKPDEKGMVPGMVQRMIRAPEFRQAMNIRGLANDQVTGLGAWGTQLAGEVLTREFRYRDSKEMLSALRVREGVNRDSDQFLSALLKESMGDVQPRLNAAVAAKSKTLVNQFLSNTSGWDLKRAPKQLENGYWGFVLEKTDKNAARLGRAVENDELLVNPRTGANIVLDDLGLEFMRRFQQISNTLLEDKNRIRRALGLDEMKSRPWYTPPPDTRNKNIGFTFDENNRLVPGGAIVASSREELAALARKKNSELPKGYTFRTRAQIEETADLWDRAAMDWIDPGVGPAPARGQTGTLSSEYVNPNAVQDALEWVKRQVEQNGTGVIRVLFDSQLGIARARGAVERAMTESKNSAVRSIWDEYEMTLLGKNLGDSERSITGRLSRQAEEFLDGGLGTVWPALKWMTPTQWGQWYSELAQMTGLPTKKARTFEQLATQLGDHIPYKSATDYAEQTLKISRPPEVRAISQQLNKLSASLILRYFELPHAAMNMIGIITTMPSILRSGKAPVTAFFDTQGGQKVGIVDSWKILSESMHDLTRKSKHMDWDYMVANGDTTQQVAEFNKQMSQVTDRGTFGRVFLGDPSVNAPERIRDRLTPKGAKQYLKSQGIDGLISTATDTTENWSRTWAHFAGLRLADMQGITGLEARHAFAREIANAAIANYNPMNRPELYQSAFGSMFGLFMSWMQSYNQRLFRWMETGDYANVGRQLVNQSTLFGLTSLPGYNYIDSMLQAAGVGNTADGREATIMDNIYAKFGSEVGSMLAHGGINELGIVLYTRGDMNYRDVSLDPTRLAAGLGVVSSGVKAVHEAAGRLFSKYSLDDSNRLAEILARNMPNRALKGTLSVLLNEGRDVDANGRIVSETTDAFETMVRMLGVRSSRQQAEIEAFYADKHQQQREAARQESLRIEVRSVMRSPGWENRLPEIWERYLAAGMRPEHFRTWIQNQVRDATDSRGIADLKKGLSSPKSQQSIWRYNAYGAL